MRNISTHTGLSIDFDLSSNEFVRNVIYSIKLDTFYSTKEELYIPVPVYEIRDKLIDIADKLLAKSVVLEKISKNDLGQSIDNNIPYFVDLLYEVMIPSEKEYSNYLKNRDLLELKECLILLSKALNSNALSSKFNFKFVFIDEFQDTDDSQVNLFKKLQKQLGNQCKLFVVGDLKQSIYRFRGATLSAFDLLIEGHENEWKSFTLNVNYRTNLDLLNKYDCYFNKMGNNCYLPYTIEDRLFGQREITIADEIFQCYELNSEDEDAFYNGIYQLLVTEKKKLEEENESKNLSQNEKTIALLTRSNYQVDKIVNEMSKRGLNIEISSGGDLYQTISTIDFYKLLLCLCDFRNLLYIVNLLESNYFNVKINYQYLKGKTVDEKRDLLNNILNEYCLNKLSISWNEIIEMVKEYSILVVIKKLFDGLKPWINYSNNVYMQKKYIADYKILQEKLINFDYTGSISCLGMLNILKTNIVTSQKEMSSNIENYDNKKITIVCNTIHKSKGLEYGVVISPFNSEEIDDLSKQKLDANYSNEKLSYVVEFENGIIEKNDNYDYQNEIKEQIKEETRILYVSMTRAIRKFIWIKDLKKSKT